MTHFVGPISEKCHRSPSRTRNPYSTPELGSSWILRSLLSGAAAFDGFRFADSITRSARAWALYR